MTNLPYTYQHIMDVAATPGRAASAKLAVQRERRDIENHFQATNA